MTDDRLLERAARSWIEEGPTRAPDRSVEAALRTIDSTPQERDLRVPWRLPRMNPMTRLAMMAVVSILVVGAAAVFVLRPPSNTGGPASPSPTVVPTRSPAAATPQPSGDIPLVPATPLPDPSGAALPANLIGRTYAADPPETNGDQQSVLTLRGADDPHCMAMYEGRSTCFTVLWGPKVKPNDPGARGSARIVDGNLVLGFALVPFDLSCVGTSGTFAIEDGGATLRGVEPACAYSAFKALPTVFDTQTIASEFALPMKVTMPAGWKPLHDGIVGALGIVNTGVPEGPDSTWWGPDLLLVDGARIHDPSDVVSDVAATFDGNRFVPWPADFFAYITSLPGVTVVSGPEPITVGGVTGTQIAVMTPPMHPLVWLEGDFTWLGGGQTGVDPAQERRFAVVETGGHTLFVQFGTDPSAFDARDAEVRAILAGITFD